MNTEINKQTLKGILITSSITFLLGAGIFNYIPMERWSLGKIVRKTSIDV